MVKQSDETKIAVLAANSDYMKRDIAEIRTTLQNFPGVYFTQKEHAEFVLAVDQRFKERDDSIRSMEMKINNLQRTVWMAQGGFAVIIIALKVLKFL